MQKYSFSTAKHSTVSLKVKGYGGMTEISIQLSS